MDYYKILNVAQSATDAEIKSAYRKLAKEHHPDRGGSENTFRELSEAYNILSDPEKRKLVDAGIDPNNPQQQHWNTDSSFDDFFARFNFRQQRPQYHRNRSVITRINLSLEEVFTGKEIDAEVALPGDATKIVTIKIPAGVLSGQQIKFSGMGDSSVAGVPAGDLVVHVGVFRHSTFDRDGADLIYTHSISVWDAMLGTTVTIETLDKTKINVKVKPGTQPGTVMRCAKEGLPILHSSSRGDLYLKINVDVPRNLTEDQKDMITELQEKILTTNKGEDE